MAAYTIWLWFQLHSIQQENGLFQSGRKDCHSFGKKNKQTVVSMINLCIALVIVYIMFIKDTHHLFDTLFDT